MKALMRHINMALALIALAAAHVTAAEYIVDQANPAAGDGNPGTAALPLKTIQAAAQRVRAGDWSR